MRRTLFSLFLLIAFAQSTFVSAVEPASDEPKPIPATRPEIKVALEALKLRTPRLPLPESAGAGGVNNGRMRAYYLPESWSGGPRSNRGQGQRRGNNSAPTLDYVLTTSCFWIVSRGNNCHYCLGHQELKLAGAGVADARIAALDSSWTDFDPTTQAALAYARKLTLEPQLVGEDDIATLSKYFTNDEIIELTFVISRFNSTNRWTDGLGIPQDSRFREGSRSLLSPTDDDFLSMTSLVTAETRTPRGPIPTFEEAAAEIEACRRRLPRVELPSEMDAAAALGSGPDEPAPQNWERAMSVLSDVGPAHVRTWNAILADDQLTPRLKAEIAYITAINNRAWYAAGIAAERLSELGAGPDSLAALHVLDEDGELQGHAAAHRLARKLTTDPHLITDRDIALVRAANSDAETAQIVHVICMANLFDRFTEALGLPLE